MNGAYSPYTMDHADTIPVVSLHIAPGGVWSFVTSKPNTIISDAILIVSIFCVMKAEGK